MPIPNPLVEDYAQPSFDNIPRRAGQRWPIQCIDMQILTKDNGWNQDQTKRRTELLEIWKQNCNYVSFAMPYDNGAKWKNYIADARAQGFSIYFRPHWNSWEGDNSATARVTRERYLDETYDFIVNNPSFWRPGDIMDMNPESSNANDHSNYTFRTPENSGGSFDVSKYNDFNKKKVTVANAAFKAIGLEKQIHTWASSINLDLIGPISPSLIGTSGRTGGLKPRDFKKCFNGIITIDHYMSSSIRNGTTYADQYSRDLDNLYAWSNCKFLIGEWGYHTEVTTTDAEQAEVYQKVIEVLKSKPYIVGVNFWNHMGQSQSSLWSDSSGTIVPGGRIAVKFVREAFTK